MITERRESNGKAKWFELKSKLLNSKLFSKYKMVSSRKLERGIEEEKSTVCIWLIVLTKSFYRVFDLESELKFLRPTIITIQEYETKVDQLTKQMTLWEQDTATIQEQKQYIEKMISRWRATENILESYRESEKLAKAELR